MRPTVPPSAILFDLDRTICVRDQRPEDVMAETFAAVGVEPYCTAEELFAAAENTPTATSDREFYELCFAEAARQADANPEHAPALARAQDEILDHSRVSFLPGAEATLSAVRDEFSVGLVTNGSEETQTQKLAALDIAEDFDTLVFAAPETGVKPDAAPFEHALDALCVSPTQAIHVGDSLHADVAGANAMGIRSVWVPPEEYTIEDDDPIPDHTLDALTDLPTLLRGEE